MQDDHPLWYDHAEPEAVPSRTLLVLAGLFAATAETAARLARLYRAPDRLWRRTAGLARRRQGVGAPRS